MKVGDLVRFYQFPDKGYGIIIRSMARSAKVCWASGSTTSVWKKTLEVINGRKS